jgi:hypothetical protein
MQCLARTRTFQRCRKGAVGLVCRTHRFQPWAAALFVLTSAGALVGFSRDLLEPWQRDPSLASATSPRKGDAQRHAQLPASTTTSPIVAQTMINSPGSIQSDAVLHSLFVEVTFETDTPESPTGPPSSNEGIQMLGALETADGKQILLATDWRYEDHQRTTRSRGLFFRFAPEPPAALNGQSVDDLTRFNKLLLGLKKAFAYFGFAQQSREIAITVRIVANGVEVASSRIKSSPAKLLADDSSILDIKHAVAGIPRNYRAAVR